MTPIEEFQQTYEQIVRRIAREVDGLVLVSNVPNLLSLLPAPFADYRLLLEDRLRRLNDAIAQTASAHNVTLVDLFDSDEVDDPRNIGADGFHPSIRGYRVMAQSFVQTLANSGLQLPQVQVD